jgi:hypothetical protein
VGDRESAVDHVWLREALDTYVSLTALRHTRGLDVGQLITCEKARGILCKATDQSDPELACQRARHLLRQPEPDAASATTPAAPTQNQPDQTPPRASKRRGRRGRNSSTAVARQGQRRTESRMVTPLPGEPRTGAQPSAVACMLCGQLLPKAMVEKRLTVHPLCQPVPCRGCRRPFLRNTLVKRRCPACFREPVQQRPNNAGGLPTFRTRTSMEKANRERQAAQRIAARRLSKRTRRTGCKVCGNQGDHLCGRQWRLADGRIVKRPRGSSIRAVSGGLPTLGK